MTEKKPKGIVEHKAHRRNVKHKIKLGMFEALPEAPRVVGGPDDSRSVDRE
jgi:hypothetical protein